ncbi:hypothetical protein B0H16DRAFT_1736921 [Mycena metata]|uniref:Uncharacterized protein n=1 Tax=Mycena metata TaxID=1033252 RepID=A0AAD7HN13_9AGAR|nr:hypothetical protein B0H16DRAFT_1736921 [Mycena metata]
MSLAVNGLSVLSAGYQAAPRTCISSAFYARLPTPRKPCVLVTTTVPGHLPVLVPINCDIVPNLAFDILLGLYWADYIRECLLSLDYHLDSSFNTWAFFSLLDHPLGTVLLFVELFPSKKYDYRHCRTYVHSAPALSAFIHGIRQPMWHKL